MGNPRGRKSLVSGRLGVASSYLRAIFASVAGRSWKQFRWLHWASKADEVGHGSQTLIVRQRSKTIMLLNPE